MPDVATLTPIAFIKLDLAGAQNDGFFMSCTLPSGTINQSESHVYDQQGGNMKVHQPSHVSWSPINLTRGVDTKKAMYDWFMKLAEAGPEGNTKEVKIELLDQKKKTIMTWSLTEAWISSYSATASTAGGDGIAVEDMQITYTTAKRV
jgi:phage tail-like protein